MRKKNNFFCCCYFVFDCLHSFGRWRRLSLAYEKFKLFCTQFKNNNKIVACCQVFNHVFLILLLSISFCVLCAKKLKAKQNKTEKKQEQRKLLRILKPLEAKEGNKKKKNNQDYLRLNK